MGRLEPAAACPMEVGDGLRDAVTCGWLVVPRDRRVATGDSMRLAYTVVRAGSDRPLPDPVVVHFGGPAGTLWRLSRVLRSPVFGGLRERRDIIFLDQRGTGYSEPRPCRALNAFFHDPVFLLRSEREANAEAARLAAACGDSARAAGLDLASFEGSRVAEDYEDLRRALGYESWNWYGASYGGRLGQILLRDHPESLRSVILDSPAVLGAADYGARPFGEALDQLFASCEARAGCREAYPRLAEDFDRLMARLEVAPETLRAPPSSGFPGGRFVVNRNVALFAVQQGLAGATRPAALPAILTAAADGTEDALYAFAGIIARPWSEELDMTLSLIVRCREMDVSEAATMEERERYPRAAYGGWMTPRVYALCDALGVGPAPPEADSPPGPGQTPVLVFGGGRDTWSAPSAIRALGEWLGGATLVYAPDRGHGVARSDECTRGLVSSFIARPRDGVDDTCLDITDDAAFVTDLRRVEGMGGFQAWVTGYLSGRPSAWRLAWAVVPLLVLLSALVAWPALLLWRWRRPVGARWSGVERAALAVAAATAVAALTFWAGLYVATLGTARVSGAALAVGVLGEYGWVFPVGWAVMGLSVLLVPALVAAWRQGYWGPRLRAHFSIVALAAMAFTAFIAHWPLF